ncbi:MAG: ATP-dependent DNA helicase RecG [Spirochaetaceae bacterium]|jgi:ATP-dependent DNA helicase RecG|nr:ATP-dependent DNA helicase RecG [Spirochaetaceae bacterium]
MFLRELNATVDHIRGAGPAAVRTLANAGISSVAALLCRYPRDWEDRSREVPLRDYDRFPSVCTVIRVLAHDWFGFGRMRTLKVHVEDQSARAVLVCFNRPFLEKQLIVGKYYRIWGRFSYKYGDLQSTAFEIEAVEGAGAEAGGGSSLFGRILPVYPLGGGLTQALLRRLIHRALSQYAPPLEDELPPAVAARDGLLPKAQAIRAIHFPASPGERDLARKTLIYEELFYLEILVGKRVLERRPPGGSGPRGGAGPRGDDFSPLQRRLLDRLPFSLTAGQLEAVAEINRDMAGSGEGRAEAPMARLLQGDVGSGKTLVSFLAALKAVDAGGQAALLAPTELLARQHAETAASLLEPLGVRPAFLTGNLKAAGRKALLRALSEGEIDLMVGTHALFSADVVYRQLRLVVVDEQHRFGVIQRSAIMAKGLSSRQGRGTPDLLMMSATPIPRTLALTVFGDLDVSVIRDLPPGRKPVKTHLARQSNEGKVYDFVEKELAAGHQAYFVYPLIEAGERGDLKDLLSMAERLGKRIFPRYPLALIHSRLEEEEKRKTMEAFRRGDIRILAATSVVEVGVDVPNATCMVIEQAERFGLSALHQLRGRVGRGPDQAYCFLVYSDGRQEPEESREPPEQEEAGDGKRKSGLTEDAKIRLRVMLEHSDGFVIAEEDLKLRGPGQITGLEQSGYLSLGIADPVRDAAELEKARTDAFAILEQDPGLLAPEHLRIAEVLKRAPPFSQITW